MSAHPHPDPAVLSELRSQVAEASLRTQPAAAGRVTFGVSALDEGLGGGLKRAALHEIYAPGAADHAAAAGFSVGFAIRAAGARPILWVRQDMLEAETGRLHPPGLAQLGLDPSRILLVRARDAVGVLRAGAEAARCSSLGAVVIEPWGEPRLLDLTASRRLALAAESAGVAVMLLRVVAQPVPSAALTRWQVQGLPSQAREAGAPGDPAFAVTLLRHRGGLAEREWRVEWSRDQQSFQERTPFRHPAEGSGTRHPPRSPDAAPLSQPVVSFHGNGSATAEPAVERRRAG